MVRKNLIGTGLICVLLSCWINRGSAAEVTLPQGTAPAPIVSGHFPDRVHEFVWRNWNAVEPAALAKILGTSVENVDALAASMGLPPATMIPPEMKIRGYITLIRRNWHLLPYDQLLELVGMTPERLDFVLREDDMLWYKLGLLKPKCAPLCYHPPDVFAAQFEKMAAGWESGIAELQVAVDKTPADRRKDAEADLRLARAARIHFQSVANQARFVLARDTLATPVAAQSPDDRDRLAQKSNASWNLRSFWPTNFLRSCRRTRGLALNPPASTSIYRWTSWKKWSIAGGCWGSLTSRRLRSKGRTAHANRAAKQASGSAISTGDPMFLRYLSGTNRQARLSILPMM